MAEQSGCGAKLRFDVRGGWLCKAKKETSSSEEGEK